MAFRNRRPSEICEDSDVERRYPPKIEPAACSGGKTIEMRRRRRENNRNEEERKTIEMRRRRRRREKQ